MTNNLKKFTINLPIFFLLVTFFFVICQADATIRVIIDTSVLFFTKLFPCMFIFYTLSDLLLNYGILNIFIKLFKNILKKVFHIDSTSSYIIFMSLLTGFPSGSKFTADFYQKKYINKDIANYLLTFTHFSNPLFILGTIKILYNTKIAVILLISHYLSNFILAFLIRPKTYLKTSTKKEIKRTSFSTCLNNSFQSTLTVVKIVFSTTVFFVAIISLFTTFIHNSYLKALIFGIFDLTKGVTDVNNLTLSLYRKGILICTFLSLGSVSIHMQVKSLLVNTDLSYSNFLKGRLAATALSLIIYLSLWHFLGN